MAPVYLFLTCYFLVSYAFSLNLEILNTKIILTSYLLIGGFGYVWIYKVFLFVSVFLPLINNRILSVNYLILNIIVVTAILINMGLSILNMPDLLTNLMKWYLLYIIPYVCVAVIGSSTKKASNKGIIYSFLLWIAVFITSAIIIWKLNNGFVQTQEYKYPPNIYYLSYAMIAIFAIYGLFTKIYSSKGLNRLIEKGVIFISKNTMWIYLWHIVFDRAIRDVWYIKFGIVLLSACCIVIAQNAFKKSLLMTINNNKLNSFVKLVL